MSTYNIIRFHQGFSGREVIQEGLTLEEAQEHCSDSETSSKTASSTQATLYTEKHGPWFDGYEKE